MPQVFEGGAVPSDERLPNHILGRRRADDPPDPTQSKLRFGTYTGIVGNRRDHSASTGCQDSKSDFGRWRGGVETPNGAPIWSAVWQSEKL